MEMWLVKRILSFYNKDERPSQTWLCWPDEILLIVFSKLDLKSLINCMHVNRHWRDVGGYYCQRYNLWERLIEAVVDNSFVKLQAKSVLDSQDLFHNILQWYNMKNCNIDLIFKFSSSTVKNICILKDNLIICSNYSIKYCDINEKNMKIRVQTKCEKYIETCAFSAKIYIINDPTKKPCVSVRMINKLHKSDCQCPPDDKINPLLAKAYLVKAYLNTCYIINTRNILMAYRADYCQWKKKFLARYYGEQDSIYAININKENVYVLLKRGDVLYVDMECKQFVKIFDFYSPFMQIYSDGLKIYCAKPILFHKCSVFFAVSSTEQMQISPPDKNNQVAVACPGMTHAIEHGPVVIVGCEGGKIEVYLTKKLLQRITTPELSFDFIRFMKGDNFFTGLYVKNLAVYEGSKGHHLFIATDTCVLEFIFSVDYKSPVFEKIF